MIHTAYIRAMFADKKCAENQHQFTSRSLSRNSVLTLRKFAFVWKETVGLATGGSDTSGDFRVAPPHERPTLAEAGIDKKLSSRAQKIAAIS